MLVAGLLLLAGSCGAEAACKEALGNATVQYFVEQPTALLKRFPNGGHDLSYSVRNFASFNRATLVAVGPLIAASNDLQKDAIGQGLAMAAVACLARDGETARQIADFVRQRNSRQVLKGFLAYVGDEDPSPASAKKTAPTDDSPSAGILSPDLIDPRGPLDGAASMPTP